MSITTMPYRRNRFSALRLRLIKRLLPSNYRVIRLDSIEVSEPAMAANDLVRGGNSLSWGNGCDPGILYNGAKVIRALAEPKCICVDGIDNACEKHGGII